MSLLNRKPISIGRAQRALRDDRVFVVATDDTYAPQQYFEHLPFRRVKVVVLPTPAGTGECSPGHVVARLVQAFRSVKERGDVQEGDEFWVFLDTDHYIREHHLPTTLEALRSARQAGFELAMSNPCFELWLLLHHAEIPRGTALANAADVAQRLRAVLGQYNKTSIKPGHFPMSLIPDAIRRARALEDTPDNPVGPWPEKIGTRVYRLFEHVLPIASP